MRFGAFTYAYSTNIGDEIQTLAAMQYLPNVDLLIERDRLHWRRGADPVFVIFNGWFTRPFSWPPPDSISPLFVAFHANIPNLLIDKKLVDYFKRHEPIGCRNLPTVEAFRKIGVAAYFSACLTLTLRGESLPRTDQIYAVDVEADLYTKLVPGDVRERAIPLSHEFPAPDAPLATEFGWRALSLGLRGIYKTDSPRIALSRAGEKIARFRHSRRLAAARGLLARYSTAKLVITSRLHCALPCLALGTPVVLLRQGVESDPRFSGLRELVRFYGDASRPIQIDWNAPESNPVAYLGYAKALRETCESAVSRVLQAEGVAQDPVGVNALQR